MAFNIQFISHPSPGVVHLLSQRIGAAGKKSLADDDFKFSAVALLQGRVVDMIAAMDIAEKAADVRTYDLKGICPQHITMIGIFGDVAAVKASIQAIEENEKLK